MNKVIKYILFLVAPTPLLVDKLVFHPYISPKTFFFRTILTMVSIIFIFSFTYFDSFRKEIIEKLKRLFKNPIFISILIFILLSAISTIFAFDKYSAFWGYWSRGDGLITMIYLFIFLIFLVLFFEKKDWLIFLKLSLFTTLILLIKEFIQFFSGASSRPDSLLGNPTFLSGYLIFSILFSLIVFFLENGKLWKYLSLLVLILSVVGIFMTQTRGTILGLFVGFVITLIYGIVKGKDISYKKINLRKTSIVILFIISLFSVIFICTRSSNLWQGIPGVSRMAVISREDSTTNTRILMQRISLKAVDPRINNFKNLLIGYGPENFNIAYGKYFNPDQFQDEVKWLDRSHNKFLDVLVMNGLIGLISYLLIFVLCFVYILSNSKFSFLKVSLLFGLVTYIVHLFFVFDQPMTYIGFFTLLSFLIFYKGNEIKQIEIKLNKNIIVIILSIFIFISIFAYFRNDMISYIQMRKFFKLLINGNCSMILENVNSVFEPLTISNTDINKKLFSLIKDNFKDKVEFSSNLANISLNQGEDYLDKNPNDFIFKIYLANEYTFLGNELNNLELLNRGEFYLKDVLRFVHDKPDVIYGLALNLFYQGRYKESFDNLEWAFDLSPEYYDHNRKNAQYLYINLFRYFYQQKDLPDFIRVVDRLKFGNYPDAGKLDQVIEYINKTNSWPIVSFN